MGQFQWYWLTSTSSCEDKRLNQEREVVIFSFFIILFCSRFHSSRPKFFKRFAVLSGRWQNVMSAKVLKGVWVCMCVCVCVCVCVWIRGWISYHIWQLVGQCRRGRMELRRKWLLPWQCRARVADGWVARSCCQLKQWELWRNNGNHSLLVVGKAGLRHTPDSRDTCQRQAIKLLWHFPPAILYVISTWAALKTTPSPPFSFQKLQL